MAKEFGVYKEEISPSADIWVKQTDPTLELGIADDALLYTETDAMAVAGYLNSTTEDSYRVGKPTQHPPR